MIENCSVMAANCARRAGSLSLNEEICRLVSPQLHCIVLRARASSDVLLEMEMERCEALAGERLSCTDRT